MIKKTLIFCLAILLYSVAYSQSYSSLSLKICDSLLNNSSNLALNNEKYLEVMEVQKSIYNRNYTPDINVVVDAHWQNEVTEFDLSGTPFDGLIDPISQDQYLMMLQINQTVWDGGVTKNKKEIEGYKTSANIEKNKMEIFELKKMISNSFYNILLLEKNIEVLNYRLDQINNKKHDLQAAVNNGLVLKSELDVIEVELLQINQSIEEINFAIKASINIMEILLNIDINDNATFEISDTEISANNDIYRPEISYLNYQKQQIEQSSKLLNSTLMPKLFLYSNVGYGRPSYNMLSNDFAPMFKVGAKLVWTPFDWNKTKKNKELNNIKIQMLNNNLNSIQQNIDIQLNNASLEIEKYNIIILDDIKIIELRRNISSTKSQQMLNGSLNASDYLNSLKNESLALLKLEIHKIKREKAITEYILNKENKLQ